MELMLARSIAGHDKNQVYVVLGTDDKDVILINGTNRTIDFPKIKRRKHVALIKKLPGPVKELAAGLTRHTDEDARRLVRMYLKEESEIV